jgi:hypothetical protein
LYKSSYLSQIRTKKKYHNKTQVFGGRKYDSKLEAKYAEELEWRRKAGEIKEIIPQFKIDLKVNGIHICNYYVDFKIIMADGSVQFHEAKGYKTDVWILKWKLTQALLNEIEPGAELLLIQ